MINARAIRRGLLAGLLFATVAAPAAQATHFTCSGFEDPACNVRYVYQHSVSPLRDEIDDTIDPVLDLVDAPGTLAWIQQVVNQTVEDVGWTLYEVQCGVFGAC